MNINQTEITKDSNPIEQVSILRDIILSQTQSKEPPPERTSTLILQTVIQELHYIVSEGEGVTIVGERTVVQTYDGGLQVFGPVTVPAAEVTTAAVKDAPHTPNPPVVVV